MNMEKRKPDLVRWIIHNSEIKQVNIWQSSTYRHGSDWDFTNHIQDMYGNTIIGNYEIHNCEFPGFETRNELVEDCNKKIDKRIEELEKEIQYLKTHRKI